VEEDVVLGVITHGGFAHHRSASQSTGTVIITLPFTQTEK
jgi:hypothetical protein